MGKIKKNNTLTVVNAGPRFVWLCRHIDRLTKTNFSLCPPYTPTAACITFGLWQMYIRGLVLGRVVKVTQTLRPSLP